MSPAGNLKMAMHSLASTRWRSLLTMLGVVIGVCSVVTVVSIGEGIKHQIVGQINHLGQDLITVRSGQISANSISSALTSLNLGATSQISTLTDKDVQTVISTPNVQLTTPLSIVSGALQLNNQTFNNATVIGTTPNAQQVLNQPMKYGAFYSDNDANQYEAVLGQNIANELFPGRVPLGQTFDFRGQSFIVVGEFSQFDASPLSLDADFNNVIFIPYSIAQQYEAGPASIYEIFVKPASSKDTGQVVAELKKNLQQNHGNSHDFSVLKQKESLAVSNSILTLMTDLISGIAAISLVVGGIGIMNVMLVAVTERTSEIGIRKAIGATSSQILNQFLIEAVVLSLIGGILGVGLSLLANLVLRILTSLQPIISWEIVGLAAAVSLVVGVIFGIIPAIKAARKNPIDALRYQ